MKKIINKRDVAQSLLKTAILLFFEEKDPISRHLLVASAHQILHDLSKRELSIIKTSPKVKEEYRQEWIKYVNNAQNFFKHSENDPNGELEFNSEQTIFLLFDALSMFQEIFELKMFKEGRVFVQWFRFQYKHLIQESEMKDMISKGLEIGVDPNNKALFLEMIARNDI